MGLQLEDEGQHPFDFDMEEVAKQVIQTTLELEQCPYEVEVSLLLTNDEIIQKLNYDYRGINQPTDVLSFPMNDRAGILELFKWESALEDTEDSEVFLSSFVPESGELILGDIVISVDTLIKQAKAYGHSNRREVAFLITHSMLHLLGYDHAEEEERLLMEEKQEQILNIMGIVRDDAAMDA